MWTLESARKTCTHQNRATANMPELQFPFIQCIIARVHTLSLVHYFAQLSSFMNGIEIATRNTKKNLHKQNTHRHSDSRLHIRSFPSIRKPKCKHFRTTSFISFSISMPENRDHIHLQNFNPKIMRLRQRVFAVLTWQSHPKIGVLHFIRIVRLYTCEWVCCMHCFTFGT